MRRKLVVVGAVGLALSGLSLGSGAGAHTPGGSGVPGAASTWSSVDVGANHTCAVEGDGSLWCWGDNTYGQLGDGTTDGRLAPVPVGTGRSWAAVSAGGRHTCAIDTAQHLYCWGSNTNGQLGLGDSTAQLTPTRVPGSSWQSVSAGAFHTCSTRAGTLFCWGDNDYGQSAGGSGAVGHNRLSPQQIGHRRWLSVAAGQYHTCGVQSTKRLFCWGDNNNGQLGLGDTANRFVPVRVHAPGGPGHLPMVTAGYAHSCAEGYGQLFCWGGNSSGQLGIGSTDQQLVPTRLESGPWSKASAGSAHTCAVRRDGSLWCWGDDFYGQLGDGGSTGQLSPIQVGSSTGWTSVTAGEDHTCGLQAGGSLWCWGFNGYGQLGDGTTTDQHSPIEIPAP